MDFSLKFKPESENVYSFTDRELLISDLHEDSLHPIVADILDEEDNSLGMLFGYLIADSANLWELADAESSDCETIASAVCNEDGRIRGSFRICVHI